MRIAILRCQNLPAFVDGDISDYDHLLDDDRLLIAGFKSRGHNASSVIWSDPAVDWSEFNIAIVRSTWDYIDRREEFLNVLSKIESLSCKLFNSAKVIRWNSDKNYLLDLEKWGIPIIPTFNASVNGLQSLQNSFIEKAFTESIIKPAVGAGGADVYRVRSDELVNEFNKLEIKYPHHEFIIQPLINSVMSEGEWSYVYVNGELCHALLKKPAPGDYRTHVIYGGSIVTVQPSKDDLRQANEILAKIPFDILYARLDFVRIEGRLVIMELELIEPILYFNLAPKGVELMVTAAIEKFESTI